jgi:hypothetical protein
MAKSGQSLFRSRPKRPLFARRENRLQFSSAALAEIAIGGAPARRGRIDLKGDLPMFRLPELGHDAHDSRQTRRFILIET